MNSEIRKLYWWLFAVCKSLTWVFAYRVGTKVWYCGEKWVLLQGVCKPHWDLYQTDAMALGIHESEFRLVLTPCNLWRNFYYGYRFYMGYWYKIWLNSGSFEAASDG